MALILCPECGKQISDRALSCPNCGCPISAAPAVQQNPAEEVQKLIVLARRARAGTDSKNAQKYYEQILTLDPGNWEAIFYTVYFEAAQCKIMNISSAANSVANCMYSTFAAIGDLESEAEQDLALDDVIASAKAIAAMFINAAVNHYNQHSTVDGAYSECDNRVVAAANIYGEIENSFKAALPGKTKKLADFQRVYLSFLDNHRRWFDSSSLSRLCSRLQREIGGEDPTYDIERKIADKTSQINSLPTVRTLRVSVGAVVALWILSTLILILGITLYMEEESLFLVIMGIVFLGISTFFSIKTPSQSTCEYNIQRVRQLKKEIADLQNQLHVLRGEPVNENAVYTVQIKMFDTAYDTGGQCYAALNYTFTDGETGEVLGRGTQGQILTLKLDQPTSIKCHLGRGFRDIVIYYSGGRNAKYKVIPNSVSGLRYEETEMF